MDEERYRSGRNGVDSKSICLVKSEARGFESHPLRHPTNDFNYLQAVIRQGYHKTHHLENVP